MRIGKSANAVNVSGTNFGLSSDKSPNVTFVFVYLERYSQNSDGTKQAMPVVKRFLTANGISESLRTMKYLHGRGAPPSPLSFFWEWG